MKMRYRNKRLLIDKGGKLVSLPYDDLSKREKLIIKTALLREHGYNINKLLG